MPIETRATYILTCPYCDFRRELVNREMAEDEMEKHNTTECRAQVLAKKRYPADLIAQKAFLDGYLVGH